MKIEWYPGHMRKAREEMTDLVSRIDVIIEVLDARIPLSSSNHLPPTLSRNKPWIKVLNKNDLADPAVTKEWVRSLQRQAGVRALPLSARQHREVLQLPKLCLRLAPHRGKPGKPLRAMIVGIPNAGKSTLINTMAGKSIAKAGDRAAVTTCIQQIDLRNGIILSDTPGLIWPNMSEASAYRLAATGAIGDNAFDYSAVGLFLADFLLLRYREQVCARYGFDELPESGEALLRQVCRRLGCLAAGGEADLHRGAEAFLRELRAGKLGRISLEEPLAVEEAVDKEVPDTTRSGATAASRTGTSESSGEEEGE